MKLQLFPFQTTAVKKLRHKIADSESEFQATHAPQVISFTAPTGAGKTIIAADLIEQIYTGNSYGNALYLDQPNAIFVWLSDSPELNEQSHQKFNRFADRINLNQCIEIKEDSFDQEMLSDGHIYFINTQKLSKTSNLSSQGDTRQYTIWQTLENTIQNKSDHLYLIIDEAHRGAQGRKAKQATTIMQTFIKGSQKHDMEPFPIIIGMSATPKRFNELVKDVGWRRRFVQVTTDEVRSSGLLKDRIIVTYPENNDMHKDMAVLEAATEAWQDKWDHWAQYCETQHYAYVDPIFVIQVANKTKTKISATDLDACLQRIEAKSGHKFTEGEVIHSFGDTRTDIMIDGLKVPYANPSDINDDKNIKVVFFKESLSTGWDCPRAEVMISFRHAKDSTYIEQLLGRMIRTPMQMHIEVDDSLNDVRLFLPYFDKDTVDNVVEKLRSSEGSNIAAEVDGEVIGETDIWSAVNHKPINYKIKPVEGQLSFYDTATDKVAADNYNTIVQSDQQEENTGDEISHTNKAASPSKKTNTAEKHSTSVISVNRQLNERMSQANSQVQQREQTSHTSQAERSNNDKFADGIDRTDIINAVNHMGLLTYEIRRKPVNNYLKSLLDLSHLLTQAQIQTDAVKTVHAAIVAQINDYIQKLKQTGKYADLAKKAQELKLSTRSFDVFGRSITQHEEISLFSTNADIDRQYELANKILGSEGIGNAYARKYSNNAVQNPIAYKIDVILFVADQNCLDKLNDYAKNQFHAFQDKYRLNIARLADAKQRKRYNDIVTYGDSISKHALYLPYSISAGDEKGGEKYTDHLYVNADGYAQIKLNSWEQGVIKEEEKLPDFVTWLRVQPRKPWALTIPYQLDNVTKAAYPDFIIVRRDPQLGYIVDILEPHNPRLDDNLGKAKGFAAYAKIVQNIGHIELIKQVSDELSKKTKYLRLDLAKSEIQNKVFRASGQEELNHIFTDYGQVND